MPPYPLLRLVVLVFFVKATGYKLVSSRTPFVIMVPLILPVAVGYGIHPVHLGIIFLANMQIGYFTPPVGMNLFIASYRFNRPLLELYAACVPFMIVLLVALMLITYVPWLSMAFIQ